MKKFVILLLGFYFTTCCSFAAFADCSQNPGYSKVYGNTVSYYDGCGKKINSHHFYYGNKIMNYDQNGNYAGMTKYYGTKVTRYDKDGNITDSYKRYGTKVTHYDKNGKVTASYKRIGNKTIVYDGQGKVTGSYKYRPDGRVIKYDKNGKVIE